MATRPLRRLTLLLATLVVAVLSCGREPGGPTAPLGAPGARYSRALSIQPVFPPILTQAVGASGLIPFDHVHLVLLHADGSVALDTVVTFPVGADTLTLFLTVPLAPGAPDTGEPLALNMDYVNAAGVTVFHGGPVTVTATPPVPGQPPPPPLTIQVNYTGPGASAAHVVIAPRSATVLDGDAFSFTAVATDAGGTPMPGTPIVWTSADPTIATVTAPAAGAGVAQSVRGTAHISAQLLTGPLDVVTVQVALRASALAAQSGGGQSATVNTALANPLVVRVTASDGVGVGGVAVTFAVATGGGSVGSASVTTDASGLAQSTWTLGSAVGAQTATASATGLTGSPATFSATGLAAVPVKLVVTTQPASTTAGAPMAAVVITAKDVANNSSTTFTGSVSVAFGANPGSATLGGTVTVNAVAGVATFSALTVNRPGTGYTLVASATGLASATTSTFDVAAGAAQRLEFGAYPVAGATAGATIDAITVLARDAAGNAATTFTGTVTLAVGTGPAGATLHGVNTKNAVNGVATFDAVSLTTAGSYTLAASASGVTSVSGPAFPLAAGPAAGLAFVSGLGQSGIGGASLALPIVVQVTDAFGNAVAGAGRAVTFAVVSGGGSVGTPSATTSASGVASTTWTLGNVVGAQGVSASSAGLTSRTVSATATGLGSSGTMQVFGGNNQFAVANTTVLTPPSVIVRDAASNPVSGVAVTFTAGAGSTISGPAAVTTASNGIATVGGWTLGATGSFTLTASAAGYTNVVFTGTVNTVPMSVTSAEKLPNGTQQFSVVGGNEGDTYTWTVNGINGGNSTFGTITSNGFYTAPAAPPVPATFAVCAQSNQTPANRGCINVTITATPSAGGELIVMNDINWADLGLAKSGGNYVYPGTAQFVKNLVGFTTTGVRSSASKVLMLLDDGYQAHNGLYASFSGDWSEVGNIITGEGFTTAQTTVHSDLNSIPSDVKVLILMMPGTAFATSEINGLKTFASQGGRILFIGENGFYYAYGLALEDAFLASMGALMTNTGACDAQGVIVNSVPHQLTAGIAASGAGGFYMNCVSDVILGPNDFALMTYSGVVVAGIAKIDLTLNSVSAPTPQVPNLSAMRAPKSSAMSVQDPNARPGTAGWTGTGPPPATPPRP